MRWSENSQHRRGELAGLDTELGDNAVAWNVFECIVSRRCRAPPRGDHDALRRRRTTDAPATRRDRVCQRSVSAVMPNCPRNVQACQQEGHDCRDRVVGLGRGQGGGRTSRGRWAAAASPPRLPRARPGDVRGSDGLVDAVWPDGDAPPEPRQAIQTYVSRLRGALGPEVVVTRDGGYTLDVGVHRRRRRAVRAARPRRAEPGCPGERAVDTLSEALASVAGAGARRLRGRGVGAGEAVRLEELRAHAIDERAEALARARVAGRSRRRSRGGRGQRRRCASGRTCC